MFEKIKLFLNRHPGGSETTDRILQKDSIASLQNDGGVVKPITDTFSCPYCQSKNFVRRGLRVKKRENVQLYLCKDCGKTFTPHSVRGKHYPLATIFDAISLYNLGYSLEESCRRINQSVIARNEMTKQSSDGTGQIAAVATLPRNDIRGKLVETALELPVKIARAHSVRFSDKTRAIAILEDVMLGINILIVYLEQYRDIENKDIEIEFFEEQINSLSTCRWKVMHLARSWEKFSQTQE